MTEAAGTWLVIDNTYENFRFSGAEHVTVPGANVIHVFSFSKVGCRAGGMTGRAERMHVLPSSTCSCDVMGDSINVAALP